MRWRAANGLNCATSVSSAPGSTTRGPGAIPQRLSQTGRRLPTWDLSREAGRYHPGVIGLHRWLAVRHHAQPEATWLEIPRDRHDKLATGLEDEADVLERRGRGASLRSMRVRLRPGVGNGM